VGKSRLKLVTPATEKRIVGLKRPPNAELRTREYLTEAEVERLMEGTKGNRYGHRDATMILVAYRHGLRVSELVDLRCGIRWTLGPLRCTSVGSSRAPQALTLLWATSCEPCGGSSASKSQSGHSYSRPSGTYRSPRQALRGCWSGQVGGPSLATKSIRSCLGAPVARALRAYLGHKNIQHTVRYTELSPNRFENFRRE
jgi:hypothetical protein